MTDRILELEIGDVAFGGKGVGRAGGKAVFVPFTIEGERVRARVTREKKKFAEANLEEVLLASPGRTAPPCVYFRKCGGCSYQHMEYGVQLAVKERQVEQTLRRIGGLDPVPMRAAIPSPAPLGYRNRIRVHVSEGRVGFFATDGHTLVDVERCLLASDEVNAQLAQLRSRPPRDGDCTLRERGGEAWFSQTNPGAAARLREIVAAEVDRASTVLIDAYAGAGFFARSLRDRFERVFGIEENEAAVAAAREEAAAHERYLAGPVEMHLGEVLAEAGAGRVTLIVDPPSAGLSARVLDAVMARPPAQMIYVSCNPATLGRDLGELAKVARLESVTPVDMFPQTAEIEVVACLRRTALLD